MTATPGQAAREAFGELGADWYPGTPWNGLHEDLRAQWEAAAQAVLNQAFPGLREQVRLARADRDQLRKHVLDLAAALDISAAATRPSRKSSIESEIAIALRKAAEPPS